MTAHEQIGVSTDGTSLAENSRNLFSDLENPVNQSAINSSEQPALFEMTPKWKDLWGGMPSFTQKDATPFQSVQILFRNEFDRQSFSDLIGQKITGFTKTLWYPRPKIEAICQVYKTKEQINPRYPIYIISKGRWDSRLTSKALERMNVPYRIVVEPQEFDSYASVIDSAKIFVLPFSNLGQGSIPARNWVWEHASSLGVERYWILDDNIAGFTRQHENQRIKLESGICFAALEDFADRYTNLALAGFNYRFLGGGVRDPRTPAFVLNTRIYSCILIQTDIPYRWRGRYNEDTDLSLRALKDGWCTILLNAFKIDKIQTMRMKGGNTDDLYAGDGRLVMAESLKEQHPDVVTLTNKKWGRWQHQVDYRRFKSNELILRDGAEVANGYDDRGLFLDSAAMVASK